MEDTARSIMVGAFILGFWIYLAAHNIDINVNVYVDSERVEAGQ